MTPTNNIATNDDLPIELQDALKDILRACEKEDDYVRKQQLMTWKKAERFWHSVQYIFWSEVNGDWMTPTNTGGDIGVGEGNRDGDDGPFYDYVVNVYKSFGESIIAALSAQMPAVRFPPDDADNDDDLITSKTYSKISDLIQRHNKGKLTMMQILLQMWNCGLAGIYHYSKSDKKYGTVKIPKYDTSYECPTCNYRSQTPGTCPNCDDLAQAQPQQLIQNIILNGYTESPKSRVCWEVYGPLFLKFSYWAQAQEDFGYLILSKDIPEARLKDMYPALAKEMSQGNRNPYDLWEKIARSPSQYNFAVNDNRNLMTYRRAWLRPWQFEALGESKRDQIDKLKSLFPDGAFVAFINDLYAESRNECMDEHWTVNKAGLSNYINSDSMGNTVIPLQEAKNTIFNLKIETMEQGIASVFADPDVLNFEDFSRHEIRPGMYVPARAKQGQALNTAFFEGPKAQLSPQVPLIEESIKQDSEFVTGGLPSIWGGVSEAGSKTASEYEASKQQALQRLSIVWTQINNMWADLMSKSVKLFIKALVVDQNYVTRDAGNYVNVWIKKAELTGKVGEVEAEGADSFPVTIAQKQSTLMKFVELNNPLVNSIFSDIENRSLIATNMGFPELKLPQEDQRIKQSSEIGQMVTSGVAVPIESLIDEDDIHIEVCKNWAVSEVGQLAKTQTPQIYQAVMEHLQMHSQNQQANQQAQQEAQLKLQMQVQSLKQTVNSVPGAKDEKPPGVDNGIKPPGGIIQ